MTHAAPPAPNPGLPLKSAAILAGLGLLVMVFSAPVANFYLMGQTVVSGDIAETVARMRDQGTPYLLGTHLLFITFLMDILVAWALYWYLRPGQPALSMLIAWSRLVYTALAFAGLWASFSAFDLAVSPEAAAQLSGTDLYAGVLAHLTAAGSLESMALALFGLHLLVMSVAIWRSAHMPRWLAVPVALAGLSYPLIHLGHYFAPDLELGWLLLLAIGELVLMVWLLVVGWRK